MAGFFDCPMLLLVRQMDGNAIWCLLFTPPFHFRTHSAVAVNSYYFRPFLFVMGLSASDSVIFFLVVYLRIHNIPAYDFVY